ncbi:uncharacterized protein LOC116774325 [Danaus plexippus]|uniref:uncharacterized protein LOC116774325 n=1 Tax=Danaus plexippus TaxID=13037 RepID=UPI002AB31FDD|nr:uncharacterized protein LOC116774325 [Danaus plexippus]
MLMLIYICILVTTSGVTSVDTQNTKPGCSEVGDCLISKDSCNNVCGCDSASAVLFYNETLGECVVNVKKLLNSLTERYNTQEKIHTEVNKVFQGVMISVILFVICASVCAFTACVYCCRINYTDRRLQNDVEALASKLKRECRLRTIKKTPTKPAEESCNIVVADADIYVV